MNWAELGGAGLPHSPVLAGLLVWLVGLAAWQLVRGRRAEQGLPYGVYEKRRFPRHPGADARLRLADVDGRYKPFAARVLDYSHEGLCLAVAEALTVGAILRVRRLETNGAESWISVWVRHCRRSADRWEVGCRMLQPLYPLLETFAHADQTA